MPSAKTAVSAKTFSRIEPYLTVVVPAAPVEAMPPIVASAPGSTEKNKPSLASRLLSATRVKPASTRTTKSAGEISMILFISVMFILIPPLSGRTWPSKDEPAPNATTGIKF